MAAIDIVNQVKRPVTDIQGKSGRVYSFAPEGAAGSKLRLDTEEVSSIQFRDLIRSGTLAKHSIQNSPAPTPARDTAKPTPEKSFKSRVQRRSKE